MEIESNVLIGAIIAMAGGLVWLVQFILSANSKERELERAEHSKQMSELILRSSETIKVAAQLHAENIIKLTQAFEKTISDITNTFRLEVTTCHAERQKKDAILVELFFNSTSRAPIKNNTTDNGTQI